jgi:hypothetical protein
MHALHGHTCHSLLAQAPPHVAVYVYAAYAASNRFSCATQWPTQQCDWLLSVHCTTHTYALSHSSCFYLTSPLNASCFQLHRTLPASQPCPLTSSPSHITSMTSSLHHSLACLPCLQDPTADSPCGGSSCDRGTVLAAHGSTAAVESSKRDNCRATHSSFNRPNGVCLWSPTTHWCRSHVTLLDGRSKHPQHCHVTSTSTAVAWHC